MEQPPYIQHSLVISKLPYLPPPKTRGCVLHARAHPRARLCAPPPCRVSCARTSPPGWVRAKSRSLASAASRKSRTRLYSYTAIPCLTCSSKASSHPDSVCISTVVIYGSSQAQYSLITQVPKLCKSFKNSFLVNMFTLLTVFRCPKCPYL